MPHVELRPVTDSDIPTLWTIEQHPVARHQFAFLPTESEPLSVFSDRWEAYRSDRSKVVRTLVLDNAPVGWIMAVDTGRTPQITFWVEPARWDKGLATAGLLALTHLMTRRPLQATVPNDNVAAGSALLRAGFSPSSAGDRWSDLRQQSVPITGYELGFVPATPHPARRSRTS